MKKVGILSFLSVLSAVILPGLALAEEWTIDPSHSNAQFSVKHLGISNVRGEFTKVSGKVIIDDKDHSKSSIEATIDATTINTRDAKRDEHLKSPDFFDTKKFPTITFKSKTVKSKGAKKLAIAGDLTMHGVTKPVTFDATVTPVVKDPFGNERRGAEATLKLNRKDFGVSWSKLLDSGAVVVGDEVVVTLDIEALKSAGAASAQPAAPNATAAAPKAPEAKSGTQSTAKTAK